MKTYTLLRATAIFCSAMLMLSSCKKSDATGDDKGSSDHYIRFKVDGKAVTYKSQVLAQITKMSQGPNRLAISGYKDFGANPQQDNIALFVISNDAIDKGIYQDPEKYVSATGSKAPRASVSYQDEDGMGYITFGAAVNEDGTYTVPNVVADAKITVTDLGTDYVKGSFSATVYLSTDASLSKTHQLAEGEFFLEKTQ